MDDVDFEAFVARMTKSFIASQNVRHNRLEVICGAIGDEENPLKYVQEIERMMHTIAGAAGTVGFHNLGASASKLESFLREQQVLESINVEQTTIALRAFLMVSQVFCSETQANPI